ncbi:C-reactive protein-like [Engraulis encrasicolus]|uniref:C-reactive protein-like n=1 Tax=Engraulis encrasicolus TaxID=184585 RepID=UPI002FD30001
MMRFLLVFLFMQCSHATPRDLTGHLMEFPMWAASDPYVDVHMPRSVDSATVCQRYFSSVESFEITLFSLATLEVSEAVLLSQTRNNIFNLYIGGGRPVQFRPPSGIRSTPRSICLTYDHVTGQVQMWYDQGRSPLKRSFKGPGSLLPVSKPGSPPPRLMLGAVRRRFDVTGKQDLMIKSFYKGEMEDFHMWDRVLQPCEIKTFLGGKEAYAPGNVVSWASLDYKASANVNVMNADVYKCPASNC